jgi:NAD(P)-dependent dehydrogenase (short-subunit alcohol dehydrogenase family)/acyl dehydratase/putative sterol carrier protein
MSLLQGKAALVTGAGGGLGRSHALALAAAGAQVLVNDPVGAEAVAEEIRRAGGRAAADAHSVATTEGAEAMVAACLAAFGRLDILVNNAGILRDKTLLNMSDGMWDEVLAVHLRGTFACTRAAARAMKEARAGGRIINTTSVAGLKGNFGQSNYAAAKAGIYGLTLTAALELGKDAVTVNAIAPLAKTRMTEAIDSIPAEYRPEDVSPVVVYLASDLAKDVTGRVIGVHGRHLFEYRMEAGEGRERKEPWTPSEIDAWLRAPETPKAEAGGRVGAVFDSLPGCFDPAKAAGWDAVLHFQIAGAGDWGVEVKSQTLRVLPGKPAAPTCTITVDADTLLGMVEGRVKGDMAFMSGKLKATKVPDLAKFGKAFDFRKLKAAAPVAPGAPPPRAAAPVELASLLARLPSQFIPEKAAGFNGTLLFKADGQAATLEIRDRACAVRPAVAGPTCVLESDGATLTALFDGALDGQKALAEKRVKVTHLPSWLKFRQMFRFEPEKGLSRALIGRRYGGAAVLLDARALGEYDAAVGDAGSPVFPVTLIRDPFTRFFEDPAFTGDLSRMVHGEQRFRYLAPLRPGDLITPRGRVLSIEDKSSGQLLTFGTTLYLEGEARVEMESRLYFRGEAKVAGSAKEPPPSRPGSPEEHVQEIPPDYPARYAAVSGDRNPIHLDPALARQAGFKDVIVHGLGTLARVAARLPKPPAELEVRFSKPVYPGETLTTRVWRTGKRFEFETRNAAGEIVLANGSGGLSG